MDGIQTIVDQCHKIKNTRNMQSVARHLQGETNELRSEVDLMLYCQEQGEDGVIGEAVDVLICAVDLALIWDKDLTAEKINQIIKNKLDKWERLYGNS